MNVNLHKWGGRVRPATLSPKGLLQIVDHCPELSRIALAGRECLADYLDAVWMSGL
jgi:hypothetical protein